jgi:hypothetical protein
LITCDSYEFVDIVDRTATAQVVTWFSETLEDWTYSFSASETLNEFVSDVANF